jgi:MFS family permease
LNKLKDSSIKLLNLTTAWLGISISIMVIVGNGFSVFFEEIVSDLGWTRGQVSLAFSIFLFASTLALPLMGKLVDVYGAKKIIIPSVTIFALGLVSFQYFESSLFQFYAIFAVVGIVAGGTSTLSYFKVVTKSFRTRRGLALGIANTGSGLGALLIPYLSYLLITEYGWRDAYGILGVGVLAITIPLVLFGLNENYVEPSTTNDMQSTLSHDGPGLTAVETLRTRNFWIIGIAFFFGACALLGYLINMVPLLTDRGISVRDAAVAVSAFGVAQLLGRVITGTLLDRLFAPYVIAALWCLVTIIFLLLCAGISGFSLLVCTVLLGFAWGGEGDILAYMVGRYFGIRFFGGIYSLLLTMHLLGGVLGPYIFGLAFDVFGSYTQILGVMAIAILGSIILILKLEPYPVITT